MLISVVPEHVLKHQVITKPQDKAETKDAM